MLLFANFVSWLMFVCVYCFMDPLFSCIAEEGVGGFGIVII